MKGRGEMTQISKCGDLQYEAKRKAVFEKLDENQLNLCSGSTLGTAKAVSAYLKAMVHEYTIIHCFPADEIGVDQGYHNW